MMRDDDDSGLECVGISIATRSHLAEFGFDFGHAYAVCVRRRDGTHFTMACKTLADIAEFVSDMTIIEVSQNAAAAARIG